MGNPDLIVIINSEYVYFVRGVDYDTRDEAMIMAVEAFDKMCYENANDPNAIDGYWELMMAKKIEVFDGIEYLASNKNATN